MLQIITSSDVPDGTYFRVASAEPELNGNVLTIYDGQGSRRSSWGAPGVTSTILIQAEGLAAVHVGFFHKHGGGQFYRYYRLDGAWQQVTWAKLTDDERVLVLSAYKDRAPKWAKVPGKLRVERNVPAPLATMTTYKFVELAGDGRMYSVFNGKTEYTIGKRMAERAVEEHRGGYYSYPTIDGVEELFNDGSLFPENCYQQGMTLVLIECEISGTILEYPNGKLASTYLKPVRIVKQFSYNHTLEVAC